MTPAHRSVVYRFGSSAVLRQCQCISGGCRASDARPADAAQGGSFWMPRRSWTSTRPVPKFCIRLSTILKDTRHPFGMSRANPSLLAQLRRFGLLDQIERREAIPDQPRRAGRPFAQRLLPER